MKPANPDRILGPIAFDGLGLGLYFYKVVEHRCPKAKEFFLSGAVVTAYKAYRDLGSVYTVVEPYCKARQVIRYEHGARVDHYGRAIDETA